MREGEDKLQMKQTRADGRDGEEIAEKMRESKTEEKSRNKEIETEEDRRR